MPDKTLYEYRTSAGEYHEIEARTKWEALYRASCIHGEIIPSTAMKRDKNQSWFLRVMLELDGRLDGILVDKNDYKRGLKRAQNYAN